MFFKNLFYHSLCAYGRNSKDSRHLHAIVASLLFKTQLLHEARHFVQSSLGFGYVYVIAWARGQLRINFTCIFKVFTKLPES